METMNTYRGIIIGCGRIGALWGMEEGEVQPGSHAAAIVANPRTKLIGLVDVNAELLKRAGAYFGAPTFSAVADALAQKPDFVIIATPPSTHEELLQTVLESAPPVVLCEKPLSDSTESASRMVKAAKQAKSIVVVNYQRRFFPLYQEARRRIQGGELGDIKEIRGIYSRGLLNNGSHLIDAIFMLVGSEAVYAEGNTIGYANGAVATLTTVPDEIERHELELLGTKNSLRIVDFGYRFEWRGGEVQIDKRGMVEPTIGHVIQCLEGETPQCVPLDGYKVAAVVEAIEKSIKEGGVRVPIKMYS